MLNRTITPSTKLPESLQLPSLHKSVTDNGIELYTMSSGDNAVVRLSIVLHCGSRHQKHPFTASATLNMLSEGTQNMTSAQISETLDFYGIFYDTSIDRDFSIITVNCLTKFLPKTLELLQECLLRPTFSDHELELYKTKRREQLRIEREKPSYLAREQFSIALFGAEHPYGLISSPEQYDTLKSEHLRAFYDEFYTARNCFAVASGDISDEARQSIEHFLSQIPITEKSSQDASIQPFKVTKKSHIEREDALQTSIRIGKTLFTKGHQDYNGMQVVAMILGGYFGSRLVQNIREDKGFTYGIYSTMVSMEQTGYFAIATDVTAENTAEAIDEIFGEIRLLQTELVEAQELETVKNMIVGEMMRILDGPFGIADIVIDNVQASMRAEYLDEFLQEVRSITPERIQSLAAKYLDPETLTVVTVGKN